MAAGHFLDLFVQDPHCRLGTDHHGSKHKAHHHEDPLVAEGCQGCAKNAACRHEASLHAHKEEDKAYEGIDKAHAHADELLSWHLDEKELKNNEHGNQGGQGHAHLVQDRWDAAKEHGSQREFFSCLGSCSLGLRLAFGREEAKEHHSQNGANGGKANEAEAVLLCVPSPAHRGNTNAQGHDEGHSHGACGCSACVKGYALEFGRSKGSADKEQNVEAREGQLVGKVEEDASYCHEHEKAHTHGYHEDQGLARYGRIDAQDLLGEHVHVRLCNGDEKAYDKGGEKQESHVSFRGDGSTCLLPNGHHAKLCAVQKYAKAHYDKRPADKKGRKGITHGSNGQVQQNPDGHDGNDRNDGFPDFFK